MIQPGDKYLNRIGGMIEVKSVEDGIATVVGGGETRKGSVETMERMVASGALRKIQKGARSLRPH